MSRSPRSEAPSESGVSSTRPAGCTNFKLRQLSRRVSRHYDAAVSATGLKNTQYSLLSHVVLLGPIQLTALAAKMQLDPSTLTRNLKPMIEQGWVVVEAGKDARSRRAVATDAGRELRAQAQQAWKRAQLALNEALGPERVVRLHALLDECMAELDTHDLGDSPDA